jgi:hypothetical protein
MTPTPREPDVSREAKKRAAVVLEVLAGSRTPPQAAEALGLSLSRYYQMEAHAVVGLIAACDARPPGPQPDGQTELRNVKKELERVKRDLVRSQSLVRLTQRTVGVAPPSPAKPGKRKRRPMVRALHLAEQLHQQASTEPQAASEGVKESN